MPLFNMGNRMAKIVWKWYKQAQNAQNLTKFPKKTKIVIPTLSKLAKSSQNWLKWVKNSPKQLKIGYTIPKVGLKGLTLVLRVLTMPKYMKFGPKLIKIALNMLKNKKTYNWTKGLKTQPKYA